MPIYGITVAIALWRYRRYFDTVFKFLPVLLMYTFLTELAGIIILKYEEYDLVFSDLLHYNNWVIYNIYNIIFFLYFFYVYWVCIKIAKFRRFILIGGLSYIAVSVVNVFLSDFITQFQMISYFVGAIFIIVSAIYYGSYLQSATGQRFVNTNLLSWLSLGMLIFFVGYLPIIIVGHFDLIEAERYFIVRRIHLLLILIMYACFILGFVKMSRKSLK